MKTTSNVRPATVQKYTLCLKSALIKIEKEDDFHAVAFCKKNAIGSRFLTVMRELNYVGTFKDGRNLRYTKLFPASHVTEDDGMKMAVQMLTYNLKHMTEVPKYMADGHQGKVEIVDHTRKSLVCFTDEELFEEIKKRGYSGELSKTKSVKL